MDIINFVKLKNLRSDFENTPVTAGGGDNIVNKVVNFTAVPKNNRVELTWQEPTDFIVQDINGDQLTLAKWGSTKILRKQGSYPQSLTDGTLVVSNDVRNKHTSVPFVDTGVLNNMQYYYTAFSVTIDNVVNLRNVAQLISIPTSVTNAPGPAALAAGSITEGYYGTVPSAELISGAALATAVGLTAGTLVNSATDWVKIALDGKILYSPLMPIRTEISWSALDAVGLVYGTKTIKLGDIDYKVRLWKGSVNDPGDPTVGIGSEFNRVFIPLSDKAPFAGSANDWNTNFTDTALGFSSLYSWMQEVSTTDPLRRLLRGYSYIDTSNAISASSGVTGRGWRPVLEVVQ